MHMIAREKAGMIRKQLYITEAQEKALKERASALGISEAELARQALDTFLEEGASAESQRLSALDQLLERTRTLAARHRVPADYEFNRNELYTDRMGRVSH